MPGDEIRKQVKKPKEDGRDQREVSSGLYEVTSKHWLEKGAVVVSGDANNRGLNRGPLWSLLALSQLSTEMTKVHYLSWR